MKKIITSLGLALTLLGSAILNQTQAQTPTADPSPFVLPANAYTFSLSDGTFTDISTDPNTVMLNVPDGTDLVQNWFFEPTSPTDMTPTAVQHASAGTENTVPCFPLGFDFKLSGKVMKYFNVNALGGANFSETPLRTAVTRMPGNNNGDMNLFYTIPYYPADNAATSPSSYSTADKVKKIDGKPSAMYLISGTEGNHVLTIQYDYAVNGDEWIFQYKFHESGDVQVVVKELNTANIAGWKSGYAFTFGFVENKMTGGTGQTNVVLDADPEKKYADIFGYYYLNIPCKVGQTQHKIFTPASTWDELGSGLFNTTISGSKITFTQSPKEGRTLTLHYPSACNELTALTGDDYTYDRSDNNGGLSATNSTYTTDIRYNTLDLDRYVNLGTIVAVLSASETPDFTLTDGTLYLKGHEFPEANGIKPTVLCNRYPSIKSQSPQKNTFAYDANGATATTDAKMITLKVEGITKGVVRYIHLYRMSYNCVGAPIYSPLCHTITVEQRVNVTSPQKLELAGLPTVDGVSLKAKAADNTKVVVIKSTSPNVVPSGNLNVGDNIGDNAKVVAKFENEQTFNVALEANEKCYFVAYSVDETTEPDTCYYSKVNEKLWISTRAAYDGLPGAIDMKQESAVQANNGDTYNDMPFGWTRAIDVPEAQRINSFKLSNTGNSRFDAVSLWANNPTSSTQKQDVVTPPIKLDKNKIAVTYEVKWYRAADGGVSAVSAPEGEKYVIQYALGNDDWQTIDTLSSDSLPEANRFGYYPLEADLLLDAENVGQYIRFRYIYQPVARTGNSATPIYHAIHALDISEYKACKKPTKPAIVDALTTSSVLAVSWNDLNTTPAQSFKVTYNALNTPAAAWLSKTSNTKEVTLTGMNSNTDYKVVVTAVCADEESYASDTATLRTAYGFPYAETMVEDTGYWDKVAGTNVYFRGEGPLDRRVTTYSGVLPESGAATLTLQNGYAQRGWSLSNGWDKKVNNRRCPQSMGVNEKAKNAWLVSAPIYCETVVDPCKTQSVIFKASSAAMKDKKWIKGDVGSYSMCKLYVLVSDNGTFQKSDIIDSINVGIETIADTQFRFDLPDVAQGWCKVAFYFVNPGAPGDMEESFDLMMFEVYDLQFNIQDSRMHGLQKSELTDSSVTYSWKKAHVDHYTVKWGLADADEYAHTVKVTEPTYTITGLADNKTYKVKVEGFCDEAGTSTVANDLTDEFTTVELCHTPTNLKVEGITHNGATFTSVSEQAVNTMVKRLIYLVSEDKADELVFEQTENTLVLTDTLKNNTTYTVQTRGFCVLGDSSEWSEPITFTTRKDVADIPDSFDVKLKVLPDVAAGTVTGEGRYEEGTQVTITATANEGYKFVAWMNGTETLNTEATHTFKATADVEYTAVFSKNEDNTANEQLLKGAFNVSAGNGRLYIENPNAITVKDVTVFNTVGQQLARFAPNSNGNLALPLDTRFSVLVVRIVTVQGAVVYKVYMR